MFKPIDVKRMHDLFRYEDGHLICRVRRNGGLNPGDKAGSLHKPTGYFRISIDGGVYYLSRVIYAMHYGDPEHLMIDHINQDKSNNRIENLRAVSNKTNKKNGTKYASNTSGQTGVVWHNCSQRWRAQMRVDGKNVLIGTFVVFQDAVHARKKAEKQYGFHVNHGRNKQVLNENV